MSRSFCFLLLWSLIALSTVALRPKKGFATRNGVLILVFASVLRSRHSCGGRAPIKGSKNVQNPGGPGASGQQGRRARVGCARHPTLTGLETGRRQGS